MYAWLVPRVIFPAYETLGGRGFWSEVRRLRHLEWRPRDEVQASSDARLRRLVGHAARNVPHYRDLFRASGLPADEVRTAADLARLPATTRSALQRGFPARVIPEGLPPERAWLSTTSGSTGVCLEFYADPTARAAGLGSYLFFLGWAGRGVWDPRVVISAPSYRAQGGQARDSLGKAARRLLLGQETHRLSGIDLRAADLRSLTRRLRRGYFIQSYPSYAARLAAEMLETGRELARYPAVVISVSETLTAANRAAIERAFRCRVVNHYSAWEVLHLAQSCPDNPDLLHVNSERAVLRVVGEDGREVAPGGRGRVLLTDLRNYAMPFVNYDIGDWAIAAASCPCGRGFPTLSGLEGRATEVIVTPAGRWVAAGAVERLLTFGCGIVSFAWEYQAVQTAADAVALRVVPTARFSDEVARGIRGQLAELLGPEMRLTVEAVDRIATEPSGKRLVIKALAPPSG